MLFPQAAGFGGGPFVSTRGDAELRLACIRAYNDWMAEEWSDFSPRFIAQCLAPLWDVELAMAELERILPKLPELNSPENVEKRLEEQRKLAKQNAQQLEQFLKGLADGDSHTIGTETEKD